MEECADPIDNLTNLNHEAQCNEVTYIFLSYRDNTTDFTSPCNILIASLFVSPQMEFCICLLLTILGYVPGIIYAIYVLVALDSDRHEREYYTLA
jgi:uncharacterized membrane protein YqaE (UPF0057 family)